jgi:hypothetical protein
MSLRRACAALLNVGAGEVHFLYYQAEADLGTETANRLWAYYHRLKYRCLDRPAARLVVNVAPRIKAFWKTTADMRMTVIASRRTEPRLIFLY